MCRASKSPELVGGNRWAHRGHLDRWAALLVVADGPLGVGNTDSREGGDISGEVWWPESLSAMPAVIES